MVFDKRAQVIALSEISPGKWEWNTVKTVWLNAQSKNKTNLFSKVGIGAQSILLTLPKTSGITLHNAIRIGTRHYFLIDIQVAERHTLEIIAADVQPTSCSVTRPVSQLDEYKRRKFDEGQELIVSFPGIRTEKYMGFEPREPMARTVTTFVLITPKAIKLSVGELVNVADKPYEIQVCHTLDEYKNEYEITRKGDV